MSLASFDELVYSLKSHFMRNDTTMRKSISPEEEVLVSGSLEGKPIKFMLGCLVGSPGGLASLVLKIPFVGGSGGTLKIGQVLVNVFRKRFARGA